ncbi:MAG TPA: pro-sigmaK processing inhibitor BofA family protein [Candidatus Flavonifractor merdigallinarum]|uniref:Pro-sigmaK processing inhibitor BofA family protein n=1 Tax=Candidatus Flavonifractor merdigallinarum TaxID=2838589 RepID=A0A9D2BY71_9FIRM|nr:pro-sigmaK processing inhibitor BofA family protein [Candidatus Flavonifractor merdigallinarum]
MEWMVEHLSLVMVGLILLIALLALRRTVGRLLRLGARTGVGLGVLALFSQLSGMLGIHLGVNLVNALVLGVLGVPGFGLLLLLNWALAGV